MIFRDRGRRLWGFAGLIVTTAAGYRAGLGAATAGFLYLLCVVLQATQGEFWTAAAVSLVAVCALAFFFVPPVLSFAIGGVLDATALVSFLITALVVTRLTASLRHEAAKVNKRIDEMQRIHEFGNQLLSLLPDEPGGAILERARATFPLKSACLFDASRGESYTAGGVDEQLENITRAAFRSREDRDEPEQGLFVRSLRVEDRVIGAIGFRGLEEAALVGSIANLVATALERAHVTMQLSHSRAEAEAQVLRSAILDALVHEFKTPLATIMTLAGSLMEPESAASGAMETAKSIEDEAARLNRLATRLLRVSRLDREAINLNLEVIDLGQVVRSVVKQYEMAEAAPEGSEVLADAELIGLVVGVLLDNAWKYGEPPIEVRLTKCPEKQTVTVAVSNAGAAISEAERGHVFDRYFRGSAAQTAPGSGLGLHVARRIVEAHNGSLTLDRENRQTTFLLTLPLWKDESDG